MVNFFKGVFLSTVNFKRHFLQRRGMERDHKDQINGRGEREGGEGGGRMERRERGRKERNRKSG